MSCQRLVCQKSLRSYISIGDSFVHNYAVTKSSLKQRNEGASQRAYRSCYKQCRLIFILVHRRAVKVNHQRSQINVALHCIHPLPVESDSVTLPLLNTSWSNGVWSKIWSSGLYHHLQDPSILLPHSVYSYQVQHPVLPPCLSLRYRSDICKSTFMPPILCQFFPVILSVVSNVNHFSFFFLIKVRNSSVITALQCSIT